MSKYKTISTESAHYESKKEVSKAKNRAIQNKYIKDKQKQVGLKTKFVNSIADKLQANTPKSEVWFKSLLSQSNLDNSFLQNIPLNNFIPDFICLDHKLIIEVDGSVHATPKQIQRDIRKNKVYNELGYKLFRVEHNNTKQALETIELIKDILRP